MFKKLRHRLTVICTAITGAILIGMALACLYVTEQELARRGQALFQSDLNSILFHIRSQNVIDHTWLSQTETSGGLMLYLEDSGKPLLFAGANTGMQVVLEFANSAGTEQGYFQIDPLQNRLRNELLLRIKTLAFDQYGLNISKPPDSTLRASSQTFLLQNGEETYYAAAASIPVPGGWVGLAIAKSQQPERLQVIRLRWMFGGLVAGAIALLGLFAWFFTARAVRPIEENRRRQMQFVSAASHELRSPLAVIQTSVSAMRGAEAQQAARFENAALAECTRMSRLIEDMLTLAGADSGSWPLRKEETDLETLLLTAMEHFEPIAAKKGITISAGLPDEPLPKCFCDPQRIGQVLAVLLDNAVSYTPDGGRICLAGSAARRSVRLSVSDNGPGVPDTQKTHIFERFYRAEESHSSKEHYGLGLCIAQEIAVLHKGRLTVSDAEGGGAAFTLVLPISRPGT